MTGRLHFVGIGGIGMSALAQILHARGWRISGSDAQASPIVDRLRGLGLDVTVGHRADLVEGAARVVLTDAVKEDNPEWQRALALGLPVQRRSELLAEVAAGHRLIAVSGTHGKTTVTAMVSAVLVAGGLDPTVVLGGDYAPFGGNARVGVSDWMVVEACEAYESFLDLHAEIALVTNIEPDHLDHHGTEAHLRASFARFLSQVTPGGCAVLCADRPELHSLAAAVTSRVRWYGTEARATVRGRELRSSRAGGHCLLSVDAVEVGELTVGVPGEHNLLNALGALAVGLEAGVSAATAVAALAEFRGTSRRFEVLGEVGGVTVVDDYAHHPTEIAATLAAARAAFPGQRLVAVFQPHLYSRTRDFAAGFAEALAAADCVVLTEIYPAREAPIPGVSSALIADPLRSLRGQGVVFEVAKGDVVTDLVEIARSGDVIVVMGAGDIGKLGRAFHRRLVEGAERKGLSR
jgi:UDP-N-acetylmuramate--alanine ligase